MNVGVANGGTVELLYTCGNNTTTELGATATINDEGVKDIYIKLCELLKLANGSKAYTN